MLVELGERLHRADGLRVGGAVEPLRLLLGLDRERVDEPLHVEPPVPRLHRPRRRAEVHGHRDPHRADDLWRDLAPGIADVLERDVATQAEADEPDLPVASGERPVHDGREVFGRAAVVGTQEAVGLARAAAVVPRHGVPPPRGEGLRHAADVGAVGAALQAVRDEDDAVGARGRAPAAARGRQHVEVQEVAVGQVEPLAVVVHAVDAAEERRDHRLPVAAGEAARGLVEREVEVERSAHGIAYAPEAERVCPAPEARVPSARFELATCGLGNRRSIP